MRIVPREKVDEAIARYINGESKLSISKELGISDSTVGRIIYKHKHGIRQSYDRREDADRKREYIKAHWCVQSAREIAAALRCDVSLIYLVAKKELGLKYPKEWTESQKKISQKNLVNSHTKEVHAKIGKSRSKTYEKEKLRVKYGLEQKTKLRISKISRKVYYAKRSLIYKFNYFMIDGDEYALGYDSETRRIVDKPKYNEEYYSNKYGLKFIEGE